MLRVLCLLGLPCATVVRRSDASAGDVAVRVWPWGLTQDQEAVTQDQTTATQDQTATQVEAGAETSKPPPPLAPPVAPTPAATLAALGPEAVQAAARDPEVLRCLQRTMLRIRRIEDYLAQSEVGTTPEGRAQRREFARLFPRDFVQAEAVRRYAWNGTHLGLGLAHESVAAAAGHTFMTGYSLAHHHLDAPLDAADQQLVELGGRAPACWRDLPAGLLLQAADAARRQQRNLLAAEGGASWHVFGGSKQRPVYADPEATLYHDGTEEVDEVEALVEPGEAVVLGESFTRDDGVEVFRLADGRGWVEGDLFEPRGQPLLELAALAQQPPEVQGAMAGLLDGEARAGQRTAKAHEVATSTEVHVATALASYGLVAAGALPGLHWLWGVSAALSTGSAGLNAFLRARVDGLLAYNVGFLASALARWEFDSLGAPCEEGCPAGQACVLEAAFAPGGRCAALPAQARPALAACSVHSDCASARCERADPEVGERARTWRQLLRGRCA